MNLGATLDVLGEREGGTARLEEAVAAYRAALEERTRERVPLDWAMTQVNLGNALNILGERENGTTRLEQACAAYRAALEEQTRERVPLEWAATQNNLGDVLTKLGEREGRTVRLEEAVAACRAALEEHLRERVPLQWAMTKHNLGEAHKTMGVGDWNGPARGGGRGLWRGAEGADARAGSAPVGQQFRRTGGRDGADRGPRQRRRAVRDRRCANKGGL
jgi:tetratricopeptide (TPR) repeat protein